MLKVSHYSTFYFLGAQKSELAVPKLHIRLLVQSMEQYLEYLDFVFLSKNTKHGVLSSYSRTLAIDYNKLYKVTNQFSVSNLF